MTNKISGRNVHRFLIKESYRIYKSLDYDVKIEYRLPNNKVADLFAIKNDEEVVIECLVKPTLSNIKEKIKNYEGYKIVIAYPLKFMTTFPLENFVDEILRIDVPEAIYEKNVTMQMNEKIWFELQNLRAKPSETINDVLLKLLKLNKKQEEKPK